MAVNSGLYLYAQYLVASHSLSSPLRYRRVRVSFGNLILRGTQTLACGLNAKDPTSQIHHHYLRSEFVR